MKKSIKKLNNSEMSICKGGRGRSSYPQALPTQAGEVTLPTLPGLPTLPSQSKA